MELVKLLDSEGWTQTRLAGLVGVSVGTICRIAKGERQVSAILALRIERATGGAVPAESLAMSDEERSALAMVRESAA